MATHSSHVISLKAFSSGLEQHTHTHTLMDTARLTNILHSPLNTTGKGVCGWHRCLSVCLCVCMSYLYANEHRRACWVVRLYVCVCLCGSRTSAGEQMAQENLEDARMLKVITTRMRHHPELCLPPPHPPPRYSHFTLMKYCYSGTLSGCLSDLRYFGTKHTFCTWLKCQMQLLGMIDRPTLQSAQHASLLASLMAERLSLLRVRAMRPSGLRVAAALEDLQLFFVCELDCFCNVRGGKKSGLLQPGSNFQSHSHL